ncbi:MAG: hypothetical protein ACK5V3_17150 [Bdellovibrionales bacterium]
MAEYPEVEEGWLSYYAKKLNNQTDLKQCRFFLKHDEFTFVDPVEEKVFKRVFRPNLTIQMDPKYQGKVTQILTQSTSALHYTDFVLEYCPGRDIHNHLLNSSDPKEKEKVLRLFDDFLADWLNYDPCQDICTSFNFDVNPGNFIYEPTQEKLTRVDFVSKWYPIEKPLKYYMVPYVKLMKAGVVDKFLVKDVIDARFSNHRTKTINYESLVDEIDIYGCTEISDGIIPDNIKV